MCTKNCKKEILCKDTLLRFRNKRFGSLSYKMTYKILQLVSRFVLK